MKTTRLLQLSAALAALPLAAACAAEDTPAEAKTQAVPAVQLTPEEANRALHDAIWRHDEPKLAELLQARRFPVEELSRHLGTAACCLYSDIHYPCPACTRLLLEAGADPHYTDYHGKTPLMEALDWIGRNHCDEKVLESVRLLLAAGSDVNARDNEGKSPLLHVVGYSWEEDADARIRTECIRMLLEAGADANDRSVSGYTALLCVSDENASCREAVRLLLEHGADASVPTPDGRTALHLAAEHGDPEVIRMLTQAGLEQDATDPAIILTAAGGGNTEWVAWLVEHGADVNAKGPHNETPIIRAAGKKNVECVRWLMEHGADIHAMTTQGETALTKLVYWSGDDVLELVGDLLRRGATPYAALEGESPIALDRAIMCADKRMARLLLEHATGGNARGKEIGFDVDSALYHALGNEGRGWPDIIRQLIAAGADVNKTAEDNERPLHIAAQNGHARAIRLLLAAGADLDARDGYGQTPLMLAARDCNPEAVRTLLAAGADIHLRDYSHRTAMLHAARGGNSETAKILLEAGADVNDADALGRTPLMLAAGNGYTRVVTLLLEHGADVNAQDAEGRTALMYGQYHETTAKRLREAGADASIRDFYGESVEAEEKGDDEE